MVEDKVKMGADLLELMKANDDLPLPNKIRVARVMMEYFKSEGYEDDLEKAEVKWRPTVGYWVRHIREIQAVLQERHEFFDWKRIIAGGEITWSWDFMTKQEADERLKTDRGELNTRKDTYNEKADAANEKWLKLEAPAVRLQIVSSQN